MTRRPWLVYLVLAGLAHPILEMLVFQEHALQPAHDNFDNDVPRLFSIAADWRQFGPSLWDPHLTSGNALFAQFAQPPLAPDVLLSFVLPPFVAYLLAAAALAFLGGLSMHLFLRDSLRLPAVACFAGGVLAVFASWPYIYGFGAPLLPLAMLWSEQAAASGAARAAAAAADAARDADADADAAAGARRWPIVRLALLGGFLVLSSQIQVVVLAGVVAFIWGMATSETGRRLAGSITRLLAGWSLGLLLGAPVLLTLAFALGDSQRSLWVLEPVANPLRAWLDQVASIAFGIPVAKLGGFDQTYGSFYPGVIGLPLLLLSLAIPRTDRRSRAALWLLLGLLAADLVALLIEPLQAQSPLLKSFQLVRVLHLVPVLLIVNVGLVVGWLATPGAVARLGPARRAAVLGLAVLGALLVVVQLPTVAGQVSQWLASRQPLAGASQSTVAWIFAGVAFAAGLGTAAVAATIVVVRRSSGGSPSRGGLAASAALAVLVLGMAVDRATFTRYGLLSGPNMGTWATWTEPTAAQLYVAAQPAGGRSISVLEHANRGLSARLDGVDGYETLYPKAYHALFGLLIAPQLEASPDLADYFGTWGNRAYAFTPDIRAPIADLLGIRWMLVADHAVDPGLAERAGDQAPVPSWLEEVATLQGTTVYRNPNAFPRTFVVHAVAIDADAEAAAAAMAAASADDLRSTVHVVDADAPGLTLSAPTSRAGLPELAEVTLDRPDRLELRTTTNDAGILVVADTYASGWVAEVDGQPAALLRVDLALRGVRVPAGEHVVTMRYQPIETYAGFVIFGLTLLGLLAWAALARARERRPPSDAPPGETPGETAVVSGA